MLRYSARMADPSFNIEDYLQSLSKKPGVYRMFGRDGEVLYVGKARKKQAFYDGLKEAEIDHNTRA